jgi:hypothetical protein
LRDPVPKPAVMAVNGIAFTLSIELAVSPATDRFRLAACCAPCGHIR